MFCRAPCLCVDIRFKAFIESYSVCMLYFCATNEKGAFRRASQKGTDEETYKPAVINDSMPNTSVVGIHGEGTKPEQCDKQKLD